MLAAEQLMQEPNTDVELSTEKLSVKTERRDSTTSESSLEHLDLGHTPKKFKAHTSTPTQSDAGLKYDSSESHHVRSRESGEDASEDPTKTKISNITDALTPRPKRHHKRRLNYTDKHASVLLEYNAANPNSLRKKFRFNRSTSEIGNSLINNNESGFVDGSSQYINTSGPPNSQSSGSSSPQEGSSSSPEGASENNVEREREEMKYLCPICEVVSATPHEFTNHIRCHNYASGDTENFTCRICSKVLSSASSLDRHVLVHTGERPFNCKYCHLTFTTNGNMHRHMRTHKQHQHNSQRRSSHGINKHNQNNNNNNQSQQNNNHTPSNNYAIITKNGKASVAATNVPNDNKFGANNEQINSIHEVYESDEVDGEISCHKSRRIDEIDEDDEPDDCSTDSSSIKSHSIIHNIKKNLNNLKHNKSSQQDNKNIDLSETNENDAMLKHCIKTINNNTMDVPDMHEMSCPVCESASFNNLLSLSEHMDSEHAEIPAKCRRCEVVFRTHRQLNVHPCSGMKQLGIGDLTHEKFPLMLREVTSAERLAETEALQFQIRSYLSEHSEGKSQLNNFGVPAESMENEQLTSETELLQQKRDHILRKIFLKQDSNSKIAETQPTENSTTPVKFESLELENTQTLSQDSKDFADIQSILNMTSSSSTSNFLKNFEQSVNTPSSNYSFDKDEEEAQDAFTAEFRKMKLRGEFPCKLCTAIYPNLRALKGHNRVHLSSVGPAGPFRCNMCPYSICDKSALVRHMRTHNGDRPYECAACNYAFTTKANCERHLRNRHGKTTREEVKRSIIYHPSEDSSCDDPTKKLHMFSSPDLDEDFIDLPYTQAPEPKDRSTPVSHLKEMLTNVGYETTAVKAHIQVKSLEKLIDKGSPYADSAHADVDEATSSAPIDLSMDVLDLSKKANTTVKQPEDLHINNNTVEEKSAMIVENGETDFNAMENNEKMAMLLAQQQQMLLNDSFPKFVDPAQYMQQLYRQLMFQPLNPFFLPNPMFASGLRDMDKLGPLMKRLFNLPETDNAVNQTNLPTMPNTINIPKQTHSIGSPSLIKDSNSLLTDKPNNATNFNLQLPMSKKTVDANLMNTELSRNVNLPPATMLPGGPVKMVIKNGVLMPKQKQRRYRTERPFACEHCSARFTLRSNMERHVKQQHPQYYAQRHRNGTHIIRGRGVNSGLMPNMSHLETAMSGQNSTGAGNAGISDQVKYAILAQQLKANRRDSSEILQQALSHGSGSILAPNHLLFGGNSSPSLIANEAFNSNNTNAINCSAEDDDPKLVIDEEKIENDAGEFEENYEADKVEIEDEKQPIKENLKENVVPKILDTKDKEAKQEGSVNAAAKKVAETILEQAIKDGQILVPTTKTESLLPPPLAIPLLPAPPPPPPPSTLKSMIAHAESVGKFLKEVASSPFKDESQDLVPVSKLVDNATNNSVSFTNIFRPSDVTNHMEQSDEEGLVASGSASESNNSGTEDVVAPVEPKKKSAYSLAPNRVSCPYCQRMFPWSSSLRRHILTHTGQKPFKCSHCPLLFTTKSNCDRHLLRKHGNIESAVSVYVPTEDVTEPIPVPKSVEEIEQQQRRREEDERRRQHEELAAKERMQRELLERQKQLQLQQEDDQKQLLLKQFANANMQQANNNNNIINPKMESNVVSPAELPYKCHLCESSFGERFQCLEHIKHLHAQDFDLLIAKGAVDTDTNQSLIDEEERRTVDESGRNVTSGKYPDYSNRKVICAFCIRRFWSTEDLRRHMRTHSGERPFQCEICLRKFTLKHSMLRHMKKHIGRAYGGQTNGDVASAGNSGSDFSDDEQGNSLTMSNTLINNSNNAILARNKMQELFEKANEWRNSRVTSEIVDHKENISDESNNHQSDLIGNLLGISDQGILNKLLSSPDEAAKLLGVEK